VSELSQPYVKILIVGSRAWIDLGLIAHELQLVRDKYAAQEQSVMVIHGGARGADSLSSKAAHMLGLAVHVYEADWARYGRAAGPKRNQTMIDENPDITLALVVHDDLKNSRGTKDCLNRILRTKIPVRYVMHYKEKVS